MSAAVNHAEQSRHATLADAARRISSPAAVRELWKGGRISPRARCVLADNPSALTFIGTNTWILSEPGETGCVVVDPGPAIEQHLEAISAAVSEEGLQVSTVVLTHDHVDHAEGAQTFADRVGVPLLARNAGNLPDGPLKVADSSLRVEVISLPGHSSDSVGFVLPDDGTAVTGDFIFLQSSTLICWPDGSLSDYLESLSALRSLVGEQGIHTLLTAHGLPIVEPLDVIDRQAAHRERRLNEIRSAIEGGAGNDLEAVLARVYEDVGAPLSPAVRLNVQAQMAYLEERGEL